MGLDVGGRRLIQKPHGVSRAVSFFAHKIFLDISGYINYNDFMGYIKRGE